MNLFKKIISFVKNIFTKEENTNQHIKKKKRKPRKNNKSKQNSNTQQQVVTTEKPKFEQKQKNESKNNHNNKNKSTRDPNKKPQAKPEVFKQRKVLKVGEWQLPELNKLDEDPTDAVYFQQIPLDIRLHKAILDDLKFRICSPIQGLALPHTIKGKDLCGRAQTGTGKTATFLISIFQKMLDNPKPRTSNQPYALILAPTRELAQQIDNDATKLSPYVDIKHRVIFGGTDYQKQKRSIEGGVDVLAATPGRLLDYIRNNIIDLSQISVLVIDEADRMLDMGFIPDVKRIVSKLPHQRQTLFFSATLTPDVTNLAKSWLNDPVNIEIGGDENMIADTIDEIVLSVCESEKVDFINRFLKEHKYERVIIFCNRKNDVDKLYAKILKTGVKVERMSGDVDQKKRFRLLEQFRSGEIPVIVATDVAGRGIHVNGVTHVINYDLPYEAENYVHRIGRTGRAGQTGTAISFACESGCFMIEDIEKYINRPLVIQNPNHWWEQCSEDGNSDAL